MIVLNQDDKRLKTFVRAIDHFLRKDSMDRNSIIRIRSYHQRTHLLDDRHRSFILKFEIPKDEVINHPKFSWNRESLLALEGKDDFFRGWLLSFKNVPYPLIHFLEDEGEQGFRIYRLRERFFHNFEVECHDHAYWLDKWATADVKMFPEFNCVLESVEELDALFHVAQAVNPFLMTYAAPKKTAMFLHDLSEHLAQLCPINLESIIARRVTPHNPTAKLFFEDLDEDFDIQFMRGFDLTAEEVNKAIKEGNMLMGINIVKYANAKRCLPCLFVETEVGVVYLIPFLGSLSTQTLFCGLVKAGGWYNYIKSISTTFLDHDTVAEILNTVTFVDDSWRAMASNN